MSFRFVWQSSFEYLRIEVKDRLYFFNKKPKSVCVDTRACAHTCVWVSMCVHSPNFSSPEGHIKTPKGSCAVDRTGPERWV